MRNLLFLALAAGPAFAQAPRSVAAPPADVLDGVVRLPAPETTATRSRASLAPLAFTRVADGAWRAETTLAVDADGPLALALLGEGADAWTIEVEGERGRWIPVEGAFTAPRRVQDLGDELPGLVVVRHDARVARRGRYGLRVESKRAAASGWLLARGSADFDLAAWVSTPVLVADEPIAILARVASTTAAPRVDSARVVLGTETGARVLALADDGEHADGARGDGLFGALLPRGLSGRLRARVEVGGVTAGGAPFDRSVQLAFPVLERRVVLDGRVEARAEDELRLELALGAFPLGPAAKLHVSAEVWGSDARGAPVPVCWLSRQLEPRVDGARWELALELDRRWIELADARAPFELRGARVQDPDTEVVYDRLATLELALPPLAARAGGPARSIVPAMLTGSASALTAPSNAGPHLPATLAPAFPALMLVHGYCSSGSIWPAADFTAPKLEFLDANQNRSHDQFAQLLLQRATQANLGSFGVVAHSQGGCAALHLLTYYPSPLDAATGPRRIQSVATPYQGTPLASLGSFACGVNNDMTPAGSATWLAGIPTWARNEVWFWTTANSGSACNFLTDFLLTNPEDGTVERFRGDLPGAHSMGHVPGWCHTTGMSNPANYTDHARNAAMNAAAAR
ncbi:MAG: hypothetical protein HZA53_07340 [Planctomycetes bacterium]|nr:hypothetical protein [Planctomycetota bacterium]